MKNVHKESIGVGEGSSGKPTLEVLLRLKRLERPDAAFWSDFERGMREKQLAAIIEPRPWWHGAVLCGRRFAPIALPVAAGVAAVLAVVAFRDPGAVPGEGGLAGVMQGPLEAEVVRLAPSVVMVELSVAPAALDIAARAEVAETILTEVAKEATERLSAVTESGESVAGAMLLAGTDTLSDGPNAESPASFAAEAAGGEAVAAVSASQEVISRNLEAFSVEVPELAGPVLDFATVSAVAPAAPLVDDLGVVERPRSARQERLLAMAEVAAVDGTKEGMAHLRERMVHRLDSEDARLASASRLGVGGDRFSLRF